MKIFALFLCKNLLVRRNFSNFALKFLCAHVRRTYVRETRTKKKKKKKKKKADILITCMVCPLFGSSDFIRAIHVTFFPNAAPGFVRGNKDQTRSKR